jgi:hypothetical protein
MDRLVVELGRAVILKLNAEDARGTHVLLL